MDGNFFNVRVYGILLNNREEVLVAEEFHYHTFMRKFPGGGLQFGEGIRDALIREIKEELDVTIDTCVHFHTTDFFVQSAFNKKHQVIAVYYLVKTPDSIFEKYEKKLQRDLVEGEEYFYWMPLKNILSSDFTFPVDQEAARLLLAKWKEQTLPLFE